MTEQESAQLKLALLDELRKATSLHANGHVLTSDRLKKITDRYFELLTT